MREIREIIALFFHLCDLYHYYCYSGVGHGALLQRELIISLLCAFIFHYSLPKMVCHYILFFAIIRYYDTIMTLIAIIAIIALFSVVEVSME